MDKSLKKRLIDVAYDVIEEEKLSRPTSIRFSNSAIGTRRREAVCVHNRRVDTYSILMHERRQRFFPDENGKYKNKKGENFRRAEIGELRSNKDIIKNMAHEVAHLKFFKHNPQHHSYTKHILEKINNRLGGMIKNE